MGQAENLRSFVAIVQHQSIGKAAEQAGIAKSAMSRKLRQLEDSLQTELIVRTTRQWEITPAGRQYYCKALNILAALDEADAELRGEQCELAGDIRISVPLHFGHSVLEAPLLEFAAKNTGVHLHVDFGDRIVDLIGEHFDLAVRIGRLSDSTMIARKLRETQHIFCASPDYISTHAPINTPRDLKDHQIMHVGDAARFKWEFGGSGANIRQEKLASVLNSNSGEFLISAAVNGMGVVRMPDFLAQNALASGELVPLLANFRPEPVGVYIIYPASRHISARVRSLIDFLVKQILAAN